MRKYLLFVIFLVLSMVLVFLIQEKKSFEMGQQNGVYKKGQIENLKKNALEKRVPVEERFSEELLEHIERGALEQPDYIIDQNKLAKIPAEYKDRDFYACLDVVPPNLDECLLWSVAKKVSREDDPKYCRELYVEGDRDFCGTEVPAPFECQ